MDKTIIIAEIKESEKFYNVTDNAGIIYGIFKEKCPKFSEQLKTAKAGDQLSGNAVEKDGKNYLWEPNEKKAGGKSFAPKDKSFDAAIAAIQAAASCPGIEAKNILAAAETFHKFIMDKATKSTESK